MVAHRDHGHTMHGGINRPSPTYNTWIALRRRCTVESRDHFEDYGQRGVDYDPRWDDFCLFLEDMGVRPEGTTLDRIDVDGDYTKDNCRWATPSEQANNRTSSLLLTIGPFQLSASEWSELVGTPRSSIYPRIARGWGHVDAVCQPSRRC